MPDSPWKKFERLTAVKISKWLAQGAVRGVEAERVICRQALLGRMVENIWGDLAMHPQCSERMRPAAEWFMGKVMVDCKNRKKFRLPGILTEAAHPFWRWWEKLKNDAMGAGQKMAFIVAMNQPSKEHILAFGESEAAWVWDACGRYAVPSMDIIRKGRERVSFMILEKFLDVVDPVALGCPMVEVGNVPQEAEQAGA
jgi:hypothetical protein